MQPDTLSVYGTQYAQMTPPNVATDANTVPSVNYSLYGDDFSHEFIEQMLDDQRFQQIMNKRLPKNYRLLMIQTLVNV